MPKVNIDIDMAESFDRLSIIELKQFKDPYNKELEKQSATLISDIQIGIGDNLFYVIYNSQEYKNLKLINSDIFTSIDELRMESAYQLYSLNKTSTLGLRILRLNDDRYKAKQELQNTFLGDKLEEIKV